MSSNTDLARRAIEAFNAREVEAFADLTAPGFEWFPSMSPIEGEVLRGREGVLKYFAALDSAWELFQILPVELREQGDSLVVLGRLMGRGRGSGASTDAPLGMAFDIRDGLIARIRGYLDTDEALDAVGTAR
jgi:ketosteroid isomerase-like protein